MVRFRLDPTAPPQLTEAERARLDAMSDAEITAAAEADPDNPPLTDEELARIEAMRTVRRVRARTGLSQDRFAGSIASAWAGCATWNRAAPTPIPPRWPIWR